MKTGKHLIISGILFTIVLFLWPVFMAAFQPQGTIDNHFVWIHNNAGIYKLQFFFAFLLSPSIIYLMYSQLNLYPAGNKIELMTGTIFLAGYLVLNSISYASQMTIVPLMIEAGLTGQAKVWYFSSPTSIAYFLNQTGYCFWALGALILFTRLVKEKGTIKYISIIYMLSAILSVAAFAGLIIENKTLNSMTLYSGLVLIPVGIMSVIRGVKVNKSK